MNTANIILSILVTQVYFVQVLNTRWFTVTDCIPTKITLKQKEKLGGAMNPSMDKSSLKISFRYKNIKNKNMEELTS